MLPSEVESRTHGSRPRTQKKIRGQGQSQGQHFRGQTLSRPRTGMLEAKAKDTSASALQKNNRSSKNFFQAFSSKKHLKFFFRRPTKFQQFKKKCCPRAENRAIFEDLRPRGQGLELRGQGQGLQNVSSRTPPLVAIIFYNFAIC